VTYLRDQRLIKAGSLFFGTEPILLMIVAGRKSLAAQGAGTQLVARTLAAQPRG
jgi:hypothetical protein